QILKHGDIFVVLRSPVRTGMRDWGYSEVEAFDATNGESLWKATIPIGAINVGAGGDMVYARSRDGWLHAFRWKRLER
ncbi:MAG: hypothetical protein RDV41_11455, partial [Planctomycetota bacterium]|nr:hypothetical protein [Planctomycetota bacterium]